MFLQKAIDIEQVIEKKIQAHRELSLKGGAQKVVEVVIEGISPLLQDRFTDEQIIDLQRPSMLCTGVKPDPDYEKSLFLDKDGLICEPSGHLEAAMVQSAGEHKIKGARGKTYKRSFKAAVFVVPELIPHMIQKIEKLTTPIPNNKGGRTTKVYPKLETGWKLNFFIQVHDEQIPALVVKEVLENAGKRYGIGAWRPRHGRFTITKWEELN